MSTVTTDTVTIDDKNRITLPAEVVDRLGLVPGDCLSLNTEEGGRLVLTAQRKRPPIQLCTVQEEINRKNLETPIQYIKGVGPKLAEKLARKGIATVEDALYILPVRYEDRRELRRVNMLRPGATEVFYAEVLSAGQMVTRGGRRFFEAIVGDETGSVALKWFNFNPRYMKGIWLPGKKGIFTGEVTRYGSRCEIHHPEVEWAGEGCGLAALMESDPVSFGRTVPVYPLTEGLSQKLMRKVLKEVVDGFAHCLATYLHPETVSRHGLLSVAKAVREVHFPANSADPGQLNEWSTAAHRTLSFDELFYLELGLALKKRGADIEEGICFTVTHKYTRPLLKILPYSLTEAQRRVLTEIKNDMAAPHPMHRLVQGDVGSGKTIVALLAALLAVENGYQAAIMAPTEILAEQHYLNVHRYCEQLGIEVSLLTSSLKGKTKKRSSGSSRNGKSTHCNWNSFCNPGQGRVFPSRPRHYRRTAPVRGPAAGDIEEERAKSRYSGDDGHPDPANPCHDGLRRLVAFAHR